MPSQEDIRVRRERLKKHRNTLAVYLNQFAIHGSANAPPSILHGIREAREGISQVKQTLRSWGVSVEDYPDDEDEFETNSVAVILNREMIKEKEGESFDNLREQLEKPSSVTIAASQEDESRNKKYLVKIIRPNCNHLFWRSFLVFCDNKEIATLRNGESVLIELDKKSCNLRVQYLYTGRIKGEPEIIYGPGGGRVVHRSYKTSLIKRSNELNVELQEGENCFICQINGHFFTETILTIEQVLPENHL